MKKGLILLLISLILIPVLSFGQSKIDGLLSKLNKLHKENRVLGYGKIEDIFLNKTDKTIDIDNKIIPLTNYTANYEEIYNLKLERNVNVVKISCLDKENCMIDSKTQDDYKSLGFYFKTKKACYDFINLIEEIKQVELDF